jgi:hypothetical protein
MLALGMCVDARIVNIRGEEHQKLLEIQPEFMIKGSIRSVLPKTA